MKLSFAGSFSPLGDFGQIDAGDCVFTKRLFECLLIAILGCRKPKMGNELGLIAEVRGHVEVEHSLFGRVKLVVLGNENWFPFLF